MLLIVAHHYAVHGGFDFGDTLSVNRYVVQVLSSGGKLGVNVFVLISGYFLCTQTKIRWQSIFCFIFQLSFYSLAIYFAYLFWKGADFSLVPFIKRAYVIRWNMNGWWFVYPYLGLCLISPFLSRFLLSATQKEIQYLIAVLTFMCVNLFFGGFLGGNNFCWFVYLFIIAAYIRLWGGRFVNDMKTSLITFVLSAGIILLSCLLSDKWGSVGPQWYMTSPVCLIASVSLFCIFRNMKYFYSKTVNMIAAAMFGVYLIHDSVCGRSFLWRKLFKNASYQNEDLLIFHAMLSIAAVFIGCTIVSCLYNLFIDKPLRKLLKKTDLFIMKACHWETAD